MLFTSQFQNQGEFHEFNCKFDNLRSIGDNVGEISLQIEVKTLIDQIYVKYISYLSQMRRVAFDSDDVVIRTSFLVRAKVIATFIPVFQIVTDLNICGVFR